MDHEKIKENVLLVLGRKGPMTISNLKLFAGAKESKEDFLAAVNALAGEGKVNTKEGPREGSLSVALPGAQEKTAPTNDATVPSKPTRRVNRKARTTDEPVVRNKIEKPIPSNGGTLFGSVAAVISDLEARRAKIDTAIETLRALA